MSSRIDKPLEDIIKEDKSNRNRGNKRGFRNKRGSNRGRSVRGSNRFRQDYQPNGRFERKNSGGQNNSGGRRGLPRKFVAPRQAPRNNPRNPLPNQRRISQKNRFIKKSTYRTTLVRPQKVPQNKVFEEKRKRVLKVSGLHFDLSNNDLFDMFKQYGPLKRCRIAYDLLGRSLGNAAVEYEKTESARKAISELNGAEVDGNKIVVEYSMSANREQGVSRLPRKRIQKEKETRRDTRPWINRGNRRLVLSLTTEGETGEAEDN